jgi:hypothetical protein
MTGRNIGGVIIAVILPRERPDVQPHSLRFGLKPKMHPNFLQHNTRLGNGAAALAKPSRNPALTVWQ